MAGSKAGGSAAPGRTAAVAGSQVRLEEFTLRGDRVGRVAAFEMPQVLLVVRHAEDSSYSPYEAVQCGISWHKPSRRREIPSPPRASASSGSAATPRSRRLPPAARR